MRRPGWRALSSPVLVVLLAGGFAACGDDDDSGDVEAYCEQSMAIETFPDPDIDFETATPAQLSAAIKTYASQLRPLAEAAQRDAPDDVRDDVDVLVAALDEVEKTGNSEAIESDSVQAAQRRVHEFDLDACDLSTSDVKGVEYAFQGIERTYDAGLLSFEFSNGGKEEHEFILFKKNAGVTETAQELMELPEDQAFSKVSNAGAVGPTAPDDEGYDVVRLAKGSYFAVCFLPVGNDPKDFEGPPAEGAEEESGPPHFTRGMVQEFTVE